MQIPASYHQERLWFIDRFERGSLYQNGPVYHNIPLIIKIEGTIDLCVLERSIKEVILRHEALRTRIVTVDDSAYQSIEDSADFRLETVRFTDYESNEKEAFEFALDLAKEAFTLENSSLIRGTVIELQDNCKLLLLVIHHIICDKNSLNIIAGEIAMFYEAFLKEETPNISDVELYYADFSTWQRDLPDEDLESLLFYWRRKLGGKLQALELPTDRQRAAIHIYHEERYSFEFPQALSEKIRVFGTHNGINDFNTLLGIFKVLLYHYSGLNEIVVGTSMENRLQEELKNVVGPIANLVVLRSNIEETFSFMDVVNALSKTTKEAEKYQAMPFDKLVLELNPENDMSRTALFDVLFQFEEAKSEIYKSESCIWRTIESNLGWGKYDLNLLLQTYEKSYTGVLTYNGDYYDKSTIERFVSHYLALCEKLLENPNGEISRISFISEHEKKMFLYEWNQTHAEYPKQKCIHTLFMEQAAKTPTNIAIKFGLDTVTYEELNKQTNTLARLLRSKGVKPDSIVGMLLERTTVMITAMLSILKAGGAYLPIHPDYPEERINYLLEDSGTEILLTTKDLKDKFSFTGSIIYMDDMDNAMDSGENIENINSPGDLAYIIYTSGTTGNPKGVMIEHRNVVRLMFNDRFQFDFSGQDVWTMFHSYNFDFSVWEMYGALLYGGKLIIVPKMVARDTKSFLELLENEKVTVLNQTPPAFYNLVNEELNYHAAHLKVRYIIFGGEALNPFKLKEWKARYPETKLINMYGITETTVHVTYKEIQDKEIESNVSNIGKPLPTLTTYVMDKHISLLPVGVAGELMVGGDGVGRGYLNRPELTAQKFITNPYKPKERLYRSGDLVRYLGNGEIEYLGRIDHQVKISGFRIELGEIEAAITKYSEIKEVVVIARKDSPGDSRLAAYIVWADSSGKDISKLRSYIKDALPEYMIPSIFVSMTSLPLTSNGKIDRKNLPEPKEIERDWETAYVEPQTETEKVIADIWKDILHIDKVGIKDNFFNIGGNSLLVTKIVYKFNEVFKLNLTFPYFFTNPTIESMAQFVENQLGETKPLKEESKTLDLDSEVFLDESIKINNLPVYDEKAEPREILLTGATGFLGAFLLKDLLTCTKCNIHCLVRAETIEDALKRIKDNLAYYLISIEGMENRIIPITGDLGAPLLGLAETQFRMLAERIDVIYHNGAIARFIYPYEQLKNANVLGTQEIIRLACMNKLKPIHYVSTVSVFSSTKKQLIFEDDLPQKPQISEGGGYAQSKWVAEGILRLARSLGVPVNIYRPGRISGHSGTGACQTSDFLWQMVKACVEAGCIFDVHRSFDMVPVDCVSKAIVEVSRKPQLLGSNVHLVSSELISLKDMYTWINSLGFSMDIVTYKEWYSRIRNYANENENSMAAKLLPLIEEDIQEEYELAKYDDSNLRSAIKNIALPEQNVNEKIFKANFMFLVNTRYIT